MHPSFENLIQNITLGCCRSALALYTQNTRFARPGGTGLKFHLLKKLRQEDYKSGPAWTT